MVERGKLRKIVERALARPESWPNQNGDWAASACNSGRCARIRLHTSIAVSGSGIPTWTCKAAVGVRVTSPRISSRIAR